MTKPLQRPCYLFVLPWSPEHPGGVNQVVLNLAREMQLAGDFEPLLLVLDWDTAVPVWGQIHSLRTVRWRIRSCGVQADWRERLAHRLWLLRFGPVFRRFCCEQRIAAINLHYPGPAVFALEHAIGSDVPLILSFHGADITGLSAQATAEVARWRSLLLSARATVVCSRDLGAKVNAVWGGDIDPIVVHNGLDAQAFAADAGSALAAQTRRNILNVAKFEYKKGQDVLIQAFAMLSADYPDVHLVLVGASDKALPMLQTLSAQLGVVERVQFYQDVPHAQVATFFRSATLFVLPSRIEPFGIVLLEAGAFGLPVVASAVGGVPEILDDGVTGRLVPPDDAAALAQCLRALLDAPAEAEALGERLRRHGATFTWAAAYAKYAAILGARNGI